METFIRLILANFTLTFLVLGLLAAAEDWPNVQTVSLAPLLAAAIRRFTAGESMVNLFQGVIHGGG